MNKHIKISSDMGHIMMKPEYIPQLYSLVMKDIKVSYDKFGDCTIVVNRLKDNVSNYKSYRIGKNVYKVHFDI